MSTAPSSGTSALQTPRWPAVAAGAAWWRAFWPAPMAVNSRERWRVVAGAAIGMALTAWLCLSFGAKGAWLVAPIGASAVLVFGVPASPLAQPWSVVGGNTLSALVGVACAQAFPPSPAGAAVAVAVAIGVMFALRCLHPPGGASALFPVLAGITDFHFVLFPVLVNSVLLVLAGIAYNHFSGRRYPHAQVQPSSAPALRDARIGFSETDLDAALARYNQVLDVPRDDLQALLEQAELTAYRRKLGQIRCADIMSRELITVEYGTSLEDAWKLLREAHVKALPVVDRARRIVGILTLSDFLRGADLDLHKGFDRKLRDLIRRTPATHSDKPEAVGQIMTRHVRVASADRHIVDLVPLFSATGHHHIPIVGESGKLVGIITQSDLVRALSHAEDATAGPVTQRP